MEEIKHLGELVENCGQVAKLLLASEIAMNDGDLALSQKNMKEAQGLVKVLIDDVFEEVKEILAVDSDETIDYDIPTPLEMARALSEVNYNAGVLITLIMDESVSNVLEIAKLKLQKAINTVDEIAQSIFFN